jgi:hypothetical protein
MIISANKWEHDVQGYLNICNITDSTPRKQIRDFAAGVNDLGLWNSMVCWPLRSTQNVGTGTTAYSLGGLGAFNGTLVNGPSWGADGIISNGGTNHIATPITNLFFPSGATQWRLLVCYSVPAGISQGGTLISRASGTAGNRVFQIYGTTLFDANVRGTVNATAVPYNGQGRKFVSLAYDGTELALDDTELTIGAAADDGQPLEFMSRTGGASVATLTSGSDMSVVIGIHGAASTSAPITDLYKQTLGTNLGLP